ncbi:2-amino-4-hydroxy-6-hydroxymethyldihydropteridine diphosphokinase [Jannaschia marina]|uniref:2-amino-4-hydroxy-6- hydroxymethyldihydropteridine diphosphokinase n=1 Tax=Jannaschia marina TaxID=2741674 RepID=UPI0015CBB64B|nr:2-amino-4-hydroxy-6-hydroxymethyldihydropteridine diphosphokinase [Jannaschia marina]
MTLAIVALGANSGMNFAANARQIARAARALPGRVRIMSKIYRTPAWPPGAGPDFANAVMVLETGLAPRPLLGALHGIEAARGRRRRRRWEARVLDLDLLAHGGTIAPDAVTLRNWIALDPATQAQRAPTDLILPHPRLQDRGFVLLPLAEILPGWRHPLTGRSAAAMAAALPARARVRIRPVGRVSGVVNRSGGA